MPCPHHRTSKKFDCKKHDRSVPSYVRFSRRVTDHIQSNTKIVDSERILHFAALLPAGEANWFEG